jgi:hypothetical protein
MIATDWYGGVRTKSDVSDRALNLSRVLDALDEQDAKLVESIARRLTKDSGNGSDPGDDS